MKILFLLKRRQAYNEGAPYSYSAMNSGLLNSAKYCHDMLNQTSEFVSDLVQVVDGNDIDREITKHRPDFAIIEALWVTPAKLAELSRLHPRVKWIVRIHSEIPFLAMEGIALEWIHGYGQVKNAFVAPNSPQTSLDLLNIGLIDKSQVRYLPNYYPVGPIAQIKPKIETPYLHVGCLGSIRPLKNHLIQAIAAIQFSREIGKKLFFHVNASRVEQNGSPVLKNLIALFDAHKGSAALIRHGWLDGDPYREVIRGFDLGMQLSFTETFNIVAADFVTEDVPILGSHEIEWLGDIYKVSATDTSQIVNRLHLLWQVKDFGIQNLNKSNLAAHSKAAKSQWTNTFQTT